MTHHHVVHIKGAQDYPLSVRYWKAENPRAIIVFVHGVVSHSLWMEPITSKLQQQGISCVATDRRGAGLNTLNRGDAPDDAALLEDLDLVIDWVQQLSGPGASQDRSQDNCQDSRHATSALDIHLCGFCWGANYVMNYLDNRKSQSVKTDDSIKNVLKSTILIAPSLFPSSSLAARKFVVGTSSDATEDPIVPIESFTDGPALESFIKPDPLRLRKVSQRLNGTMQRFSEQLWMKFIRLELPTLVVLGDNDRVVDNARTEQLFARLKCSPKSLHSVHANHGVQFDAADKTATLLFDWVESVPSSLG